MSYHEKLLEYETEDLIRALIVRMGEDPTRKGLLETPARVEKSWTELFVGYTQSPRELFKTFEEEHSDEMVVAKNIEFYSTCEHHLQPFFGVAHVAYIPKKGRVLGLSKLARLVDLFARRMQIQERITRQVTNALMHKKNGLKPLGAACVIDAKHFCMTCRGVQKQNCVVRTSSLEGVFRTKPEVRSELFSMLGPS